MSRASRLRQPLSPSVGRLRVLLLVVAVVFSLAAGRAVQVQAVDAGNVAAEAAEQITVVRKLPAFRGEITDRNGEVLAITSRTVRVIVDAKMIATNGRMSADMTAEDREVAATAPQRLAELLARYLGGTAGDYLTRLTATGAGSSYQVVAKEVPIATYRELSQAISDAGLVGISSESSPTRVYPNGRLAANVLGFLNEDGNGASGLEYALNPSLAGKAGKESFETSPNGRIPMGENVLIPPINGQAYQLTLDAGLQWQVEQSLATAVSRAKAASGAALVMDIKTGEVLALANYPSFDPNDTAAADPNDLYNRAVTDAYTPGSVQKTLTFAAMIDAGLVKPTDVVKVPGRIKSGNDYVTDAWDHPEIKLYARGVLAKSSNVGTIVLARRMDKAVLHGYLKSFGLGERTGIGLPGEASGSLPTADMPDYSRDGVSFGGSALSVTLLQEAAAVGAVANGGIYNAPYLLKSRVRADGQVEDLSVNQPRRVVSEQTSHQVVSMMETMVVHNQSGIFKVTGYRTGAKTGTSRKVDPKCNCFRGLVTSTIGVGPVEDPRLLTYVVIDDPKRGSSGQAVAGPAYQEIMSVGLARYGVPQSKTKSPKLPIRP